MKHGRLLGLFAVTASLSAACSQSAPPSQGGDGGAQHDAPASEVPAPGDADTGGDAGAQPALCPSGAVLVQYSLTPLQSAPPLGAIALPGLHPATIIVPAGHGLSNSMRFDLCQESDGLELHAILLRGEAVTLASRFVLDGSIASPATEVVQIAEGRVQEVRVPRTAAVVEGLAEAIAGNLSALRIRLPGDKGLLVVGHSDFLAVAQGRVDAATIQYTSLYVLVGSLAPGNVFAGLRCTFGQTPLTTSFRLDTAQFDVEACTFLGGGITTGYRIHRLAVQDSNPGLEEAYRGRFEFTTEAEVESVMNYRWNHHNACDSFHLTLGHANYAASTAPAAGCGPPVPEAPPRRIDEPSNAPLMYRIRYHGGAWRDGSVAGCSHFLYCQ
jgi:hypothetical protein